MSNESTMSDSRFQATVNTKLSVIDEKLKDQEERLRRLERPRTEELTKQLQDAEKNATLSEQVASLRRLVTWFGGVLSAVLSGVIVALIAMWLK